MSKYNAMEKDGAKDSHLTKGKAGSAGEPKYKHTTDPNESVKKLKQVKGKE